MIYKLMTQAEAEAAWHRARRFLEERERFRAAKACRRNFRKKVRRALASIDASNREFRRAAITEAQLPKQFRKDGPSL